MTNYTFGNGDDTFSDFHIIFDIDNVVDAGGGDDDITVKYGNDTVFGGDGNDLLRDGPWVGSSGNDEIFAGAGNDTVRGGNGVNLYDGGSGTDLISYLSSQDPVRLDLSAGTATLNSAWFGLVPETSTVTDFENAEGSQFDDDIRGTAEANQIDGGLGNDVLYGRGGEDTLLGANGNDTLDGGTGFDSLVGGNGNDALYGDTGDDELDAGQGDDRLFGEGGNDDLFGGDGQDTLFGDTGLDRLEGGSGNDSLDGGQAADTLIGGDGDDFFYSGTGNDSMTGGLGADVFVFDSVADSRNGDGIDRITDFRIGTDKIDLSAIDGNVFEAGHQDLVFRSAPLGIAQPPMGSVYLTTVGFATFVNIENNAKGAGADMVIELTGIHNLTASSFVF